MVWSRARDRYSNWGHYLVFNILFSDNDGTRQIEGVHAISGTFAREGFGGDLFFTADGFADIELIACDRGDCSGTTTTAGRLVGTHQGQLPQRLNDWNAALNHMKLVFKDDTPTESGDDT